MRLIAYLREQKLDLHTSLTESPYQARLPEPDSIVDLQLDHEVFNSNLVKLLKTRPAQYESLGDF